VWGNDLSQIELRMAALLSGDKGMMQAYIDDLDIHTQTAQLVFPGLDEDDPEFGTKRKIGKTMNFLMLYRGGPTKLQETLRRMAGLEVSYDECVEWVSAFRAARQGLVDWQDRLIAEVQSKGFLQLITGWRRTFVADRYLVEKSSINEICNFPVQNYSAQVLQSAHAQVLRERHKRKLVFVTPAQVHDDLVADIFPSCVDETVEMIGEQLKNPWLWQVLCDHVGRYVPLDYEAKRVYPRT
jgi:DNA polymerase-1